MLNPRFLTLITLILAAAATRLIPAPEFRPWNFTAVGAMCLFGGAYFQRRWLALLVPLAALALSDLVLAATLYGFGSLSSVWMSYILFALTAILGMSLQGRVTFFRVASLAVIASALFFLVSNFSVWALGTLYPHTPAGLLACYIAAIPFAQNMLLGNLFFSALMFGGWEMLSAQWPALREPALAKAL